MSNFLLRSSASFGAQWSISLVAAIVLAIYSADSLAFDPEAGSFLKAPKHCQAKLAELGEQGSNWGYKVPDVRSYQIDRYMRLMGNAWKHMHHYCGALDLLIRQEDYAWKVPKTKWEREGIYNRILKEFNYQLTHTEWNDRLLWFKAEVLKNMARANKLAGDSQAAIGNFQAAIRTFPPYLPAYWDLAQLYMDRGSTGLAQETLRNALPHARKDAYRKKINQKLRELSELQSNGSGPAGSSDAKVSANED